jgi:predicted PurR-regulated permease PerM
MTEITPPSPSSPAWGTNTKLVVALTIVVIVGALVVKFQSIITPLLIALVLSYLLHPAAGFLQTRLHFSWGLAVSLLYLFIIILLLSILTIGGVGIVQQIQSLIKIIQDAVNNLPQLIESFSGKVYSIGPFKLNLSGLDLNEISRQALSYIEPLLSRTGSILGSLAGGAAEFFGWSLFVIFVSYFILEESGGMRQQIFKVEVPGYKDDFERLGHDLTKIWNAFLRGQIIVFLIATLAYIIILTVFGVHYAIGLALIAGLARFVPYAGPFVNWTLLGLVAYFQTYKLFGMSPLSYTLMVLIVAILIDQVFDNLVVPRILSSSLKVHPAAVLVATIIAANLFGLLGIVVAAPILATVILFSRYVMRKMLDMNPWPEEQANLPPPPTGGRFIVSIRRFLRRLNLIRSK